MEQRIIQHHPVIEEIFSSFENILGNDLEKYKNHVYRVFNYSLYLSNYTDQEKYAIAAVFHDLGIWTNHTFDYLQPSIALAMDYLIEKENGFWKEEITLMIDNHHKISSFTEDLENAVEIFRKADWTDVSMGLIHFHIPRSFINALTKQFPYKGFQLTLVKLFSYNLLQHPFDPLPMFRK